MREQPEQTATGSAIDAFLDHRALLLGVAYRMLGSVGDAEDVVQEAWVRWSRVDADAVEHPRAFLVTVTTRLAMDRLRRRRSRKETYAGEWLPEPLASGMDPSEQAESSESLAMGLLLVLETLSPLERAVFVLHEAFGFSYAEIAHILGRQEAAVRQSAHRARGHVAERRPRYAADPVMHRRVTERFLAAMVSGDVEALIDVLAPDVVLLADGGGKVRAPRLPVRGAEQVIRFLRAVAGRTAADQRAEVVDLNGWPGLVVSVAGQPVAALTFESEGAVVRVMYLVADPDKLRSLSGR